MKSGVRDFGILKVAFPFTVERALCQRRLQNPKSKGWLKANQRRREQIEKLGIPVPAIPEIDLEGAEVDIRADEPIATPF